MKSKVLSALSFGAVLMLASCGGGSNNDQGVAFTLLGYNSVDDQGVCELDLFTTSINIPLSNGASGELVGGGDVGACLTVQNNMSSQGVRADRFIMEYSIVGSSLQPPTTSRAIGRIAAPAPAVVSGAGGAAAPRPIGDLPPGFGNNKNLVQTGFSPLPVEIREWLNLNRNSLPELPFNMTLNGRVAGVTTGGDSIESNPVSFSITLLEDNVIGGVPSSDSEDTVPNAQVFDDQSLTEQDPTQLGGEDVTADPGSDDLEVEL